MKRRSGFLTFMSALVPGLGYMYLGLLRKGIEAMGSFFLVSWIFSFMNLGDLAAVILIPLWCYLFFDTFNIAHRMDKGDIILDTGFVVNKFKGNQSEDSFLDNIFDKSNNKRFYIIGYALIAIGAIAIVNRLFAGSDAYYFVKESISKFFMPVLFMGAGVYLLAKNK